MKTGQHSFMDRSGEGSIEPKKIAEKKRIFEFVTKFIDTEMNNRKIKKDDAHVVIDNLVTTFKERQIIPKSTNVDLNDCMNEINSMEHNEDISHNKKTTKAACYHKIATIQIGRIIQIKMQIAVMQ